MLALEGILYKLAQTGCLKKIEIYPLTFLEDVNPKLRYQQDHAPSESSREESFIPPFYFLVAFHALELPHSNLCLHLQMGFFPLFLCLLSYYKDTAHCIWAQPNPVWPPEKVGHLSKDLISKYGHILRF